ncbi:MAG: rhomboid family intramembrane serine protease [Myxococcota bacterium]
MTETSHLVVPGGRKLAEEWALLLASQAIKCAVRSGEAGLLIEIQAEDYDRAVAAISLYQAENPPESFEAAEPAEEPAQPGFSGVGIALALFAVYALVGGREAGHPVFDLGDASSSRILEGQWWRTLTALFLHADLGHAVGNALFGAYFITAVTRSFGDGLGLLLVLLSGALGNAFNAWDQGGGHHSIGASTAVFGAIGLLVGSALIGRNRAGLRGSRLIAPLGAGLGLLAMLGVSGVRVDIWAHAYGLVAGAVMGGVTKLALPQRPGTLAQWVLGGLALAGAALAWERALHA